MPLEIVPLLPDYFPKEISDIYDPDYHANATQVLRNPELENFWRAVIRRNIDIEDFYYIGRFILEKSENVPTKYKINESDRKKDLEKLEQIKGDLENFALKYGIDDDRFQGYVGNVRRLYFHMKNPILPPQYEDPFSRQILKAREEDYFYSKESSIDLATKMIFDAINDRPELKEANNLNLHRNYFVYELSRCFLEIMQSPLSDHVAHITNLYFPKARMTRDKVRSIIRNKDLSPDFI